ncbi:MAG: ABC-type transporter, integral rane subunit [Bacillales bacterium]|jgi:osmoprotectant transport system permease protein|nr:ABC-type transporter, integral rane subunit [Bacillales bacterium]
MSELFVAIFQHLLIVTVAIGISSIIGIILGILSYWVRPLGTFLIWFAEMLQTIPSLALLALLMIIFGLGNITMIAGLVLYALLPIVRNTYTGLSSVPSHLREASKGMGMSRLQRLFQVEIPISIPMIFSGVKIALVNSLSIAVMGVLIGADGLGYIIYRGIQQQNFARILTGAVPVVLMAILFDYVMTKIERFLSIKC